MPTGREDKFDWRQYILYVLIGFLLGFMFGWFSKCPVYYDSSLFVKDANDIEWTDMTDMIVR